MLFEETRTDTSLFFPSHTSPYFPRIGRGGIAGSEGGPGRVGGQAHGPGYMGRRVGEAGRDSTRPVRVRGVRSREAGWEPRERAARPPTPAHKHIRALPRTHTHTYTPLTRTPPHKHAPTTAPVPRPAAATTPSARAAPRRCPRRSRGSRHFRRCVSSEWRAVPPRGAGRSAGGAGAKGGSESSEVGRSEGVAVIRGSENRRRNGGGWG
jgi:hypothetical protein